MQLAAGSWRVLGPRLVNTAGLFPEWAAQGRGTCSSLRHGSGTRVGLACGRGGGMERCFLLPGNGT